MSQEEKLRRERDEAITVLATAKRNLSEAQSAYAAAKKKYQLTLGALVEYVEYYERHAAGPALEPPCGRRRAVRHD